MNWYKDLYVGEGAAEIKNLIVRNIKKHKPQTGVYVLTLPENTSETLDIYHAITLLGKEDMNPDVWIIGIALGKKESYEVMEKIVMDCYSQTGSFNVHNYIRYGLRKI
ncbi:hypothetical protein [Parasporobacterium paucivorans]|uniref:hypothetical protein n=1 Tax=Parasporobacterium paucivorans TaxID=115544 RepID=UPI00116041EB|nr:hypothetical protein [Parasporobacterium paucivorans]